MPAISVVSDANIVLKWFHSKDEEEVEAAHALLDAHKKRTVALSVLDLTVYEVGNALMRGRAGAGAEEAATVIAALGEVCHAISPDTEDMRAAGHLVERHDLTFYDATYAAVAQRRSAELVTLDHALLAAKLGRRPSELLAAIEAGMGDPSAPTSTNE